MLSFTANRSPATAQCSLPLLSRRFWAQCLILLALLAFCGQTLGAVVCSAMDNPQPVAMDTPDCHSDSTPSNAQHTDECCDNCDLNACHASGVAIQGVAATVCAKTLSPLHSHRLNQYVAPAKALYRPPIFA